jgi:HEAT repeat protein
MQCPYCGRKELPDAWTHCADCGVNIGEYIEAVKLLEKGGEFERKSDYTKAILQYRKALALDVPQDKISEHLERAAAKEQEIVDALQRAQDLFSEHKWKQVVQTYASIRRHEQYLSQGAMEELRQSRAMLHVSRKHRAIWATSVVVVIIALACSWWSYRRTPAQVAQRTLKNGIISDDIREKLAAIEATGRLQDKSLAPFLRSALKEPHYVIRRAAAKALSEMGDSSAVPLLKESLSDRSWKVRIEAAQALALLGDSSGIAMLKEAIRQEYVVDK